MSLSIVISISSKMSRPRSWMIRRKICTSWCIIRSRASISLIRLHWRIPWWLELTMIAKELCKLECRNLISIIVARSNLHLRFGTPTWFRSKFRTQDFVLVITLYNNTEKFFTQRLCSPLSLTPTLSKSFPISVHHLWLKNWIKITTMTDFSSKDIKSWPCKTSSTKMRMMTKIWFTEFMNMNWSGMN